MHMHAYAHTQVERDDVLVDLIHERSMSNQWASSPNVKLGASRKGLRDAVKDAEAVSQTVCGVATPWLHSTRTRARTRTRRYGAYLYLYLCGNGRISRLTP